MIDLTTKLERHETREEWLNAASNKLQTLFKGIEKKNGEEVTFPAVLVSVGWPKGSRGKSTNNAIGQFSLILP